MSGRRDHVKHPIPRKPYPSDVSDEDWSFVAPYLTVLPQDVGQHRYALREVFTGLRYLIRSGAPWRWLPHDLPPWMIVYQQTRRWLEAGVFDTLVADLRLLQRLHAGRDGQPSAVILDSRTLQSTPKSGARAGYDGHKRRKGAKTHVAVDTLGHLLALQVTPANAQDRAQVATLAAAVQEATGTHVDLAYVDQGYTGKKPAAAAQAQGIQLQVSSCPKPSGASCCCRGAGSWSATLPGRHVSAAWRATTNGCPPCWPAYISLPLLA
jgi:transposase